MSRVPADLPDDVKSWKQAHVQSYLKANQEEYDLDDEDLQVLFKEKIRGRALIGLTVEELMAVGLTLGSAKCISQLITALKVAKGYGECRVRF